MSKYKTIDEFLADQPSEKLAQINMLREIIMQTEPNLEENLKWNAPNYVYRGEDRITFNLMNKQNIVKLILHMGTGKQENKSGEPILEDDEGMVEWNSDIRGTISFVDMSDINESEKRLRKVICNWLLIDV